MTRIGPRWVYVNPQGVVFSAWLGVDVEICRLAAQPC